MKNLKKTNQTNQILNQLISDNCLSFGRNPKLSNRKISHYISGTRQKLDIFKLYELRYLLLKMYPLIHNLFLQQRLKLKVKKKLFFKKNYNFQTQNLPKQYQNWKNFQHLKNKFNKTIQEKASNFLPKILFATTTDKYNSIVTSAAKKCQMPYHVNRWLSGSITASSSYLHDSHKWSVDISGPENKKLQQNFFKYKKKIEEQKKKIRKYQWGRRPSLVIIPDVANNQMIIKETNTAGIPVLGLVSSTCNTEIAYPIFAKDSSQNSVFFFCHFLSALILKEFIKSKHKIHTPIKKSRSSQFQQTIKNIERFNIQTTEPEPFEKKNEIVKKYSFRGQYFLDHFIKPRKILKRNIQFAWKKNRKNFQYFSPQKLIWITNQKRSENHTQNRFLKKNMLWKIKLIQKVQQYNFPKIKREIRLPINKPKFRFWNKAKFFFSDYLIFSKNTSVEYQFKRFAFRKFLTKRFRKVKENAWKNNHFRKKHKRNFMQNPLTKGKNPYPYRKRWSTKK